MIYLKDQRIIDVHAKTGVSSFRDSFHNHGIHLNAAKSIAKRPKIKQIICMVRSPYSRLLSAWRMFYMSPAINLLKYNKKINNIQNVDIVYDTMIDAITYIQNPVHAFNYWCTNNHIDYFNQREDPHFMPLYNAYSRWRSEEYKHKVVYCNRINAVYEALEIEPVYKNVGLWPWEKIREEDFFTGDVDNTIRKYYHLDLELYSKSRYTI